MVDAGRADRSAKGGIMGLFDYPEHGDAGSASQVGNPDFVFLENHSPEAWKKIIAHAETMRFSAGQVLVRADDVDDSFYILSKGSVEVVLPGSERALTTIREGSVFGEMSFFDCLPRSATIRASTAGTVIRVTRDGFTRLSGWEPALARTILLDLGKILALRLRAQNRNLPD
jgi:CRP/FNR family cyclic AMP-dependent transcriptional regulator